MTVARGKVGLQEVVGGGIYAGGGKFKRAGPAKCIGTLTARRMPALRGIAAICFLDFVMHCTWLFCDAGVIFASRFPADLRYCGQGKRNVNDEGAKHQASRR
jgi:hypothetical protein